MKKVVIALLTLCLFLCGCGKEEEKFEWTYEALEEELGGIIETDFESAGDCLKLIKNHEFYVCGYIVDKLDVNFMGSEVLGIDIADSMDGASEIFIGLDAETQTAPEVGEFVYIKGEYSEGAWGEGTYILNAWSGYVSLEKEDVEYLSVNNYLKFMKIIFHDTLFRTEGLIIQDGVDSDGVPIYKLYESEETYRDYKYSYITIEFSEQQHNLNGKTVVIIGKPYISAFQEGLKECSIIEER